jgi:hypothetical protein
MPGGVVDFLRAYFPVRSREPVIDAGRNRAAASQVFEPVGLQDFLALEVPPREMLLAPILPERSLSMLYAPRGIGKSWLGLSVDLALRVAGLCSVGMRLGLAASCLLMARWSSLTFKSD